MRRSSAVFAAAALLVSVAGAAEAALTPINSPNDFPANDYIYWGQVGAPLDVLATPLSVSSNNGLSVSVEGEGGFVSRFVQGAIYDGAFTDGTDLLVNIGYGAITLQFAQPVKGVAFGFQSLNHGAFAGALQTNVCCGGITFAATSMGFGSGVPPFIGVISDAADITSLSVWLTDDPVPDAEHLFVLGPVHLITAATGQCGQAAPCRPEPDGVPGVPEPGAWALMILGFGGAGAQLRARRRRAFA